MWIKLVKPFCPTRGLPLYTFFTFIIWSLLYFEKRNIANIEKPTSTTSKRKENTKTTTTICVLKEIFHIFNETGTNVWNIIIRFNINSSAFVILFLSFQNECFHQQIPINEANFFCFLNHPDSRSTNWLASSNQYSILLWFSLCSLSQNERMFFFHNYKFSVWHENP